MKKQILTVACALALAFPLAACGGTSSSSTSGDSSSTTASESSSDFDAVETYWGQWRGSVATTGTSVYGTTGGTESMLDVYLNEDKTFTVEPLEAHADLPTASGTWDGDEDGVTLTCDDGTVIELTVSEKNNFTANAADFGIADFDTLNLTLY